MQNRTEYIVALIGFLGVIGAALIVKMDFGSDTSFQEQKKEKVVGLWKIEAGTKHYSANYWRLYDDGSIDGLGTWDLENNQFQLTYSNGLIWNGQFSNNVISGNITDRAGSVRSFSALKLSSNPDHKVASFSACFVGDNLKCLDTEINRCNSYTGFSFMLFAQCKDHCISEAEKRKISCLSIK